MMMNLLLNYPNVLKVGIKSRKPTVKLLIRRVRIEGQNQVFQLDKTKEARFTP